MGGSNGKPRRKRPRTRCIHCGEWTSAHRRQLCYGCYRLFKDDYPSRRKLGLAGAPD